MNTALLSQIKTRPQPRKYFGIEKMASLRDSIKRYGIKNPLIVEKNGNEYVLVDGERRFRAASELHLKEVPIHVVSSSDVLTRMVEQFQIQEQHEAWSNTEKAVAILEICTVSKKPLSEVCLMLSIPEATAKQYAAFAQLTYKDPFIDAQCEMINALKIQETKRFVKKMMNDSDKVFTKSQEDRLESALVDKISEGQITGKRDYSRIKDSFRSNPMLVTEFIKKNNGIDINDMFIGSKGKASAAIRNMVISANYVGSSGGTFLKDPEVKLSPTDITVLKHCIKVCQAVINLAE